MFVVAPPWLVMQYFSVDGLADNFRRDWSWLAAFLDGNVFLSIFAAALWAWALTSVRGFAEKLLKKDPPGWEPAFAMMVIEFDDVVGRKEKRFSEAYRSFARQNGAGAPRASQVFHEITQPRAQLDRLLQGVWHLFHSLLSSRYGPGKVLKATLFMVRDQKVESVVCSLPGNHVVQSPLSSLSDPRSGVMVATRSGKIVVIDSVERELASPSPRFLSTARSSGSSDSSLICYPIRLADPNSFFVVSLYYNQGDAFQVQYADAYAKILESFALRLKLEYSLLGLRTMTDGVPNG